MAPNFARKVHQIIGETYSILQNITKFIGLLQLSKIYILLSPVECTKDVASWWHMNTISFHSLFYRDNATRFFASGFFHESSSPKSLKITLWSLQFFSKICKDIHRSKCTTGINIQQHCWQICHWCQRHRWQIFHTGTASVVHAPPVLTTPVASLPLVSTAVKFPTSTAGLPPVSMVPAANFSTCVNNTGGNKWDQYQTTYTWSEVGVNYLYVNSTTQRCLDKIIKLFWLKIFPFANDINDTGEFSVNFW